MSNDIVSLLCEGCGILSMSRLLSISATTVINRIVKIAAGIKKPILSLHKRYEVDEMWTYIGSKEDEYWIVYALEKESKMVADFKVGKRTNKTLRSIIDTLVLSSAKRIYTDGLQNYKWIVPKNVHRVMRYGTTLIERMNLNVRTHLKRLNRRSICFSKSLRVLTACLKIYWWGKAVSGEAAVTGNR